jgi:hypothetical protein
MTISCICIVLVFILSLFRQFVTEATLRRVIRSVQLRESPQLGNIIRDDSVATVSARTGSARRTN